jgi:Arm DNA-binding domain
MLTDTAIKKAQPTDKPYKMPDERGLHLLVQTTGAKLWQLRYRHEAHCQGRRPGSHKARRKASGAGCRGQYV